MDKCQEAFEKAANKIVDLPAAYPSLKIKNNILNQNDWDALNSAVCEELAKVNCTIVEGDLDPFWKNNSLFSDLLNFIRQSCNCGS